MLGVRPSLLVSLLTLLCLLIAGSPGVLAAGESPADAAHRAQVDLWFFWSSHCPHCLDARPFWLETARETPWLALHDLETTGHPVNVQRYMDMAAALGEQARFVPAFIFCGEMHIGWESAETTGVRLLNRLADCRDRSRNPPSGTAAAPAGTRISVPLIGELDAGVLSLPVLTLLVAGLDAFNPCAFFVLLFLLSLLVHLRDRRRMLLIGGLYVLVSGLMYFAFMAAWLNLFRMIGNLPWVTAAAGILAVILGAINVKDFFAFKRGVTLSITDDRRGDIFRRGRGILAAGSFPAMVGATLVLAVAANFYELLCTAGFPMIYTRLLTLQASDPAAHYLWLALYNVIYVLPLLIIVLVFVRTMGGRNLSERQGRLLKLLSGTMMLGLGLLLLLAPSLLGNVGVAAGVVAVAAMLTGLAAWLTPSANTR